jgi:hypothetical protein
VITQAAGPVHHPRDHPAKSCRDRVALVVLVLWVVMSGAAPEASCAIPLDPRIPARAVSTRADTGLGRKPRRLPRRRQQELQHRNGIAAPTPRPGCAPRVAASLRALPERPQLHDCAKRILGARHRQPAPRLHRIEETTRERQLPLSRCKRRRQGTPPSAAKVFTLSSGSPLRRSRWRRERHGLGGDATPPAAAVACDGTAQAGRAGARPSASSASRRRRS